MPNCFQLYKIGSQEPSVLQTVDDEMREHFGAPPDPEKWFAYWYDIVGFALACGKTFPELKQRYLDEYGPDDWWYRITCYLEERYTVNNWVEIGRRD